MAKNQKAETVEVTLALGPESLALIAAAVADILEDGGNTGGKTGKADKDEDTGNGGDLSFDDIEEIFEEIEGEFSKREVKALLKAFDVTTIDDLEEDDFEDFYAAAEEMLDGTKDDGDSGDDGDDGDDEVDPEELKAAIQKIAAKDKDGSVDILKAGGLNTVRGLKSATEEQLTKIFKALKKYKG